MLTLGTLIVPSNLILAPMAGITDLPFRLLNRRFGCELAFVEMLNARAISHKNKKTARMLRTQPEDRPLGVQLLGCEPEFIVRALEVLSHYSFDILDFNAACPVRKVVRRGEGAALLRAPKKLQKLLKLVIQHCRVPVTVKIRTGWDADSVNAAEVALHAQDAGISALFIHGRTRSQGYSGGVDYGAIRKVKKALSIPVIGSGDIFSAELAKKMLDETGCDGLAVARGALGNPFVFKEIQGFLQKGKAPKRPGKARIIKTMGEHLDSYIDFYGERIGVERFRKFFSCYTKGFPRVRVLREKISRVKTKKDAFSLIKAAGN